MSSEFVKRLILNKSDQFVAVFLQRYNFNGVWFKIHYKYNQLNHSRLGLIVSRNIHKKAHRRNYMKRIIHELFRHHQLLLSDCDIVVRVKKCFMRNNYTSVAHEFNQLISKLKN